MLKNETHMLMQIARELAPDNISSMGMTAVIMEEQRHRIQQECERAKVSLSGLLRSSIKEEQLKRHIYFQQQILQEIADQAYSWFTLDNGFELPPPILANYQNVLSGFITCLLALNEFIRHYFSAYCDPDGKVPLAELAMVILNVEQVSKSAITALTKLSLDNALRESIIGYLSESCDHTGARPLTYRTLSYFIKLTELISYVLEHPNERPTGERLYETLLFMNFNYYPFFNCYCEKIQKKVDDAKTGNERLLLYVEEMIFVKTIPVFESFSYEPGMQPVNVLIANWINENIAAENGLLLGNRNKLPLTVTVAQLGLLTRLLYDEGFFAVMNVSEILRFFAACFSSKKQDDISAESIRKSFYSKDPFTAALVKNLLSGMIENINRLILFT